MTHKQSTEARQSVPATEQPVVPVKSKRPVGLIVAVAVLSLAVIGLLVYVVAEKAVLQQDAQSRVAELTSPGLTESQQPKKDQSVSDLNKTRAGDLPHVEDGGTICTKHDGICVTLPKGWKGYAMERTYPNDAQPVALTDKVIVDSKDETVRMHIQTGIMGIGGYCNPEDEKEEVYIIKKQQAAIDKKDAPSGVPYALAVIHKDSVTGLYRTYIGLSNETKQVGEKYSTCTMRLFGTAGTRGVEATTSPGKTQRAGLAFLGTGEFGWAHGGTGFATYEQARAHLETPVMRQAFEVVASAHYK